MKNPKTILITGASDGIGYELTKLALDKGYNVHALSRNISKLKKISGIYSYSVNLSKEKSIKTFVNKLIKESVKLNIIINNAGALVRMPFHDTPREVFKEIYNVNVFGVVSLIKYLIPIIDKKGHVVNISSMGGIQGSNKFPGLSAYSSSKAALISLTESLAEEYKETGPSFNALALGSVKTKMLEKAFPGYKASTCPMKMASYILDFSISGHTLFNGKILPVSLSTP
ncbi:MAG: short-chain dehydrogenase [Flavobacteriaceae bacterium]|nr:short-chain dehydrogenase [Flavobacteriaceae bacterium]|tara:strand:- start:37785 stop:38468 length:684 start_codon:yes stop_codon:yes gene_type:complete